MADSLVTRHQFKRASGLYVDAFDSLTGRGWILNQIARNDKNHADVAFASSFAGAKMSVRLVFKLAQCLIELRDVGAALRALESIPAQTRNVRVNFLLGRLYAETGSKRQATVCYKSVLSVFPSSVEAVQALVDLGVDYFEIATIAGWSTNLRQSDDRSSSSLAAAAAHVPPRLVSEGVPRIARALEDRAMWRIHGTV
jgi:lipopolysaccharide biosynthesis regulator YciM